MKTSVHTETCTKVFRAGLFCNSRKLEAVAAVQQVSGKTRGGTRAALGQAPTCVNLQTITLMENKAGPQESRAL